MGFLSSLFGGGSKTIQASQSMSFPDGKWLEMEKQTNRWTPVAEFSKEQTIDLADMSLFSGGMGTFCILKSFSKEENYIMYLGCVIPPNQNDLVLICVDRYESLNGEVIRKDDWKKNRVLHKNQIPSISKLITVARNKSAAYGFSSPPPHVMIFLMMGMR